MWVAGNVIALMSMLIAIDNGYQACIMAPTEILANQHYETITEMLDGMPERGTAQEHEERNAQVCATMLEDGSVAYHHWHHAVAGGCAFKICQIIDEQQRFGVVSVPNCGIRTIPAPYAGDDSNSHSTHLAMTFYAI